MSGRDDLSYLICRTGLRPNFRRPAAHHHSRYHLVRRRLTLKCKKSLLQRLGCGESVVRIFEVGYQDILMRFNHFCLTVVNQAADQLSHRGIRCPDQIP